MYSVVYPESHFGGCSGMVPESNFGGFPGMVPERFRKRPIYHLRIYRGNLMRIRFPVALSAKIYVTLSVVLFDYFGGASKCLKDYVGFPHRAFLGFSESVRMRSIDSCVTESISVIVVTIWRWVMA